MRSTNHNEEGEQGRNPRLVEPLMSSKEVTSAAPESIFPKRSVFLSDSSSKIFTNTNPVQFQEVTLRINEQERTPSFASGALNSFSNGDVSTNNAVVPAHHSSCIIESTMEEQHVSRQGDLETPKSTFDDDAPRVINCCCQVLREQLAVEVMRRLSMELAMQKMEEEADKIRSTEGKMKELHVTEKGEENNNEILKNVGTGDEQEKKDLKEEVMKLRCILKTRDKEIEMKKLRIAFLQDELVSHILERDIDDNKRRISSRRRVRIPSISSDSTFKSRRIRTPTRSFPGMISAVNLSQSSLESPSPCTRSPLKNSSTSFIVHTPNSSLCSETRLKTGLRQKASMDRLSTPSSGAPSPFKNASFFAYKPCTSRISSSCERLNPRSAAFNLSSSASEAQSFMTYTTQSQSSRQSQAQLNALRSAIRPFSPNRRKESPLRSSGNTGGDCKKKSLPPGVAPSSGSRNVNPTCDSAFHLSVTDSRKATPLRSHPASRPTAAHVTSRRTRRSSSFTNGPTFTTTAAAYREESMRAKPSCCYPRKNERTKLSEGAVDVCRHLDELIAPLPPPRSPLKSTPLRQTISRSVLSIENRRLNLSSKRGMNDANIMKGTTTTVTFGKSKKNEDEQQRLTPRSIPFDASYDSVVGFHLEETDTKEGEEK